MNSKVRCKGCKKYVDQNSALRNGLSKFCSTDCLYSTLSTVKESQKVASRRKISEKLDGIPDEIRQKVLTADGFQCRLCKGRTNLVLHHVIYRSDKKNKPWQDQTSNLITLDNNCHLHTIHQNKKRWQEICLAAIWLREVYGDSRLTLFEIEELLNKGDLLYNSC